MAAPTYSVSLTGTGAHNPFAPKTQIVPDTSVSGIAIGSSTTNFAALQGIMQEGDVLLCKGPDGQLRPHKIDAERSTPGNIILLRV